VSPVQILEAAGIGLAAGVIGGLAGIGGSLVMLPGLALVFGYRDAAHTDQHLYMAAAMAVNVLVAVPATRKHARAGAVRRELVARVMPAMVMAIIAGVLVSDRVPGRRAQDDPRGVHRGVLRGEHLPCFPAAAPGESSARDHHRAGPGRDRRRAGFVGGLLGLGGGAVMVPALNTFARLKLLDAIATSSATMAVSAAIGASLKFATLRLHDLRWQDAAWLVAAMGPGAILGGYAGAWLAHRLPIRTVRIAISVILLLVAIRLVMPSV
jgi:uncharacterized membrane protein YfcA